LNDEAETSSGDAPATERGPIGSLFKSLSKLLATIVAIVHTRVELLTTELQEEVHRVASIMIWSLIAVFSAGIGLFLAALVVIFLYWDTHRLLASIAVTAAFFVIALVAMLTLRFKVRNRPPLLESTLAELAKDRDQLQRRL
jgi:uncharacterized membrane protein YqjE